MSWFCEEKKDFIEFVYSSFPRQKYKDYFVPLLFYLFSDLFEPKKLFFTIPGRGDRNRGMIPPDTRVWHEWPWHIAFSLIAGPDLLVWLISSSILSTEHWTAHEISTAIVSGVLIPGMFYIDLPYWKEKNNNSGLDEGRFAKLKTCHFFLSQ